MLGFAFLVGHLVGDFLVQDDFLAANKTNPHPGPRPCSGRLPDGSPILANDARAGEDTRAWFAAEDKWLLGHAACTLHCVLYTLAVFLCTWPVRLMPWWFYLGVFLAHWPVDRFRVASFWMKRVSNQKVFATGPLGPWSVVVVDQCYHLLTLYGLALLAGVAA